MSNTTNDAAGPAGADSEPLQIPVTINAENLEELRVRSGQLQTEPGEPQIPWQTLKSPVGHYAVLDGLIPRCVAELEKQQPDQTLGQIGINITMAATTNDSDAMVPALLYLFLADGAVYGQMLTTTILDANLRPDDERVASIIDSALTEIQHEHDAMVDSMSFEEVAE